MEEVTSKSDKSKSNIAMSLSRAQFSTQAHSMGKSLSRLRLRRQSMGFSSVAEIKPVERTSQLAVEFKRPPQIFFNTYQLEPGIKFRQYVIQNNIEQLLDEIFTDHTYNVQESTNLSLRLANDIMRQIKTLSYNRYRIIAVVTIGQKRAQSYNNAIAFIWDHERDVYINTQREVTSAFIQVTVFGVYLD
ncbi:hypothetical protein ACJJTC_008435 [Scirpophaga incertulas]